MSDVLESFSDFIDNCGGKGGKPGPCRINPVLKAGSLSNPTPKIAGTYQPKGAEGLKDTSSQIAAQQRQKIVEEKVRRVKGLLAYKGDNKVHIQDFTSKLHVHDLPELKQIAGGVNFAVPDKATRTDVIRAITSKLMSKGTGWKPWWRKTADGRHIVRVAPKIGKKWKATTLKDGTKKFKVVKVKNNSDLLEAFSDQLQTLHTVANAQTTPDGQNCPQEASEGLGGSLGAFLQPKRVLGQIRPSGGIAVNRFCATGKGGGIDPTCGKGAAGKGGAVASTSKKGVKAQPQPVKTKTPEKGKGKFVKAPVQGPQPLHEAFKKESTTPPPPGKSYQPDVKSGKAARVGVPADKVPPPPALLPLPNLTPHERRVEKKFMDAYNKNPDKMAKDFLKLVTSTTKPGEAATFGTDDAKALTNAWHDPKMSLEQRSINRATLNTPLHQTANAIAKRAFLKHLDTLKKGDEVMVTVGGCGSGKGFAIKNVPLVLDMKKKAKAIFDSAGDQNATENPWVLKEAKKRGLKVNYVYVHADPYTQWAHPERGVVKRAGDPNDGRMVDAQVFADSYVMGAKNHQAFYEKNKNNKNANFVFLENAGTPKLLPGIPKEALKLNVKKLTDFARKEVAKSSAPPHVKRGALMGARIWSK